MSNETSREKLLFDREIIKRLLAYFRPYRLFLILSILFLVIAKAVEAYVPLFIGNITQKILQKFTSDQEKADVLKHVIQSSFLIMGILLVIYILDAFNVWLKSVIGQKALFQLRSDVYSHVQKLSLKYYDHHTVGSLMTRTIHDVDQINQMFSESIVPLFGNVVLFLGICIGLVILDARLAVLLAVVLPISFWLTNNFRYYQRKSFDRVRSIVTELNTFIQEHLMGASTIKTFGLEKHEQGQFEKINQAHCDAYRSTIHHFAYFFAGIDFLRSLALIAVFLFLIRFAPKGAEFQAAAFFTFSLYLLMLFSPLWDLAERYNVLQSAMAAASRIFQVLDEPAELVDEKGADLDEIETISFEDVWFAYENDDWVLKGLTFSIDKGESAALVGITGSGKTTILNLLLRFYEIQRGQIKINGRDIRDYGLHTIRRQFSVVLQDPEIFSGTIFDNIALFDPSITKEYVDRVVNEINMRHLVARYSDGYNHRLEERGKGLSVGERQLISLARAVAHKKSVLLLDEATANIDVGTEKIIQEALHKILKTHTSIVIAHRLSTIKDVKRILVLHKGVLIEQGTHMSLIGKMGIYEKLYRLQFLG